MPTPLAQPETIAHAVLEKAPVAPPPPGSSQEAAEKIRTTLSEKGPRSALEGLRQRKPIEQRGIGEVIDQNIGTERNVDGSKKRPAGSEIKRRFDEAQKYATLSKDFLEKGYDGLNTAQKGEVRQFAEQAMRAWPEADNLLSGMSPADRQAAIEAVLKAPEYTAKVRSIFEGAIDPSKILPDTVSEIRTKFDDIKRREEEIKAGRIRSDSESNSIKAQLDQFKTIGGIDGSKLSELKNLERELPQLNIDLQSSRDRLETTSDLIKSLENLKTVATLRGEDITPIDQQVTLRRQDQRTFRRDIEETNGKINRKSALEQERETLEQKRQQLEGERTHLEEELKSLTQERIGAQADLASAQLTHNSQEQDFVDSLKNVFSEGTMQYLESKITEAEEVQRQLIEEEKARTVDPAEKAILDSLLSRWEKTKTIGILGKRTISELNREKIKKDFGNLMTGGPNQVMRDILIEEGGMLAFEADAKLNDPAFVEKMQPKLVERLITRRIQTGKLTEDDARRIIESDWGKGMIDNAINNRKVISDALEKLGEKGVLRGGISEWIRKKSGGNFLKFLLLILFGAAIIPAMGIKSALSER